MNYKAITAVSLACLAWACITVYTAVSVVAVSSVVDILLVACVGVCFGVIGGIIFCERDPQVVFFSVMLFLCMAALNVAVISMHSAMVARTLLALSLAATLAYFCRLLKGALSFS